ncbi:MAG: hypothetical protein ACI8TQ_003086 [Planctomycetota bacterium]|jgi:hypothetical protein
MSSFFAGMNLPRLVILIGFIASGVLAWFDYDLGTKLTNLRDAEKNEAPSTVRNIQSLSIRYTQLQAQLADDQWLGQNNPGSYARTIAQHNDVGLGQIDVAPSREEQVVPGVIDKRYAIKPVSKDRGWSKTQLGNFLYLLEDKSQQVRVTRIKIQPPSKSRNKPHEVPADEWTYEVDITSRQRE